MLEIVIDGLSADAVAQATRAAIAAATAGGPDSGILRLTAGNFGGKLGRHHFQLRDLVP